MIRGALGSRYGISPLGRGVRRASTGYTTWWTLDGDITSCVVAYQPIGADDLSDSYINLANPGTNDGVGANAPTFNASYGWSFTAASTQAVKTGINAAEDQTIIIRYSDYSSSVVMGCISTIGNYFRIIYGSMSIGSGIWGGTGYCIASNSPILTAGVYGLAGKTGYRNGVAESNICAAGSGSETLAMVIGARSLNGSNNLDEFGTLKVQAVAIYNATLTPTQMANLTTAMNAL